MNARWTLFAVYGCVSLLFSSNVPVFAGPDDAVVKLNPELNQVPVWLDDPEAGNRFDATGLKLPYGRSKQFSALPRFCLYSDPAHDPENGVGYPSTEKLEAMELPGEERYPIQIRGLSYPSIFGFAVVGAQSRDLPWRVMKAMWDGDALHVKGCKGNLTVSDVYWDNVEDGLGPMPGLNHWSLRNAYLRYIRDDAIENDDLIPGEVVNCLIDGCFTFLSQRPEPPRSSDAVTTIQDCIIHVEAQPHDGIPGKAWRDKNIPVGAGKMNRAPGMLFKWEAGAGTVVMKNCFVKIDGVSVNGIEDLRFPPGEYENVTLVWLGEGKYPMPVPPGVSITDDESVWGLARRRWIERLPASHPAADTLKRE